MTRPLRPGPPARPPRSVVFLQADADRRRIYAIATGEDGVPLGYGPLRLDLVSEGTFAYPYDSPSRPPGDAGLAADLAARPGDFHPLDDYYRAYGYPADVIAWVESTPDGGRDFREVAARLGLDERRLFDAGQQEGTMAGAADPAGDTAYHRRLATNWAVTDAAGQLAINPRAYRFKAWLSLDYDGTTRR